MLQLSYEFRPRISEGECGFEIWHNPSRTQLFGLIILLAGSILWQGSA